MLVPYWYIGNRFFTNMWGGIMGNELVGPYFFADDLNWENYLEKAPPHNRRLVRNYLDSIYLHKWTNYVF